MGRATLVVLFSLAACRAGAPRPHTIVLVPIGVVGPEVMAGLQQELPRVFHREVRIAAPIPIPRSALDPSRRQYLGSALLHEVQRQPIDDAERIVGIIDGDAYAPGLNFIFGQAQRPGRAAVVALARLRESFRGRMEDPARFRQRVLKVTTHELGHTFGFPHCPDTHCVMHFANALAEADRQGSRFCAREHLVIPRHDAQTPARDAHRRP